MEQSSCKVCGVFTLTISNVIGYILIQDYYVFGFNSRLGFDPLILTGYIYIAKG